MGMSLSNAFTIWAERQQSKHSRFFQLVTTCTGSVTLLRTPRSRDRCRAGRKPWGSQVCAGGPCGADPGLRRGGGGLWSGARSAGGGLWGAASPRAKLRVLTSGTSRHSRHSRSWDSRHQACRIPGRSRFDFPTHLGSESLGGGAVAAGGQRGNGGKNQREGRRRMITSYGEPNKPTN